MKIIAENDDGYILSASKNEVKDIIKASGIDKPSTSLGQVIPIANYIEAEKTASNFVDSYPVEQLKDRINRFNKEWNKIERILEEDGDN